jgi:hypothetical protein
MMNLLGFMSLGVPELLIVLIVFGLLVILVITVVRIIINAKKNH